MYELVQFILFIGNRLEMHHIDWKLRYLFGGSSANRKYIVGIIMFNQFLITWKKKSYEIKVYEEKKITMRALESCFGVTCYILVGFRQTIINKTCRLTCLNIKNIFQMSLLSLSSFWSIKVSMWLTASSNISVGNERLFLDEYP